MSRTDTSNGTPIRGAVALVTGGNRGFGRALVDELLERGAAKVYATSRSGHPQRDDDRGVPARQGATKGGERPVDVEVGRRAGLFRRYRLR